MNSRLKKATWMVLVGGLASAASLPSFASNPANWVDSSGSVVRDGVGECLRTAFWAPEGVRHENCAGYIAPVVQAPVVPRAVTPPPPPPVPQFTTTTLEVATTFEFDSAVLRPAGREQLSALAARLTSPDVTYTAVRVEGHTCTIGPAAYNQGLSERRARSAADFLIGAGVRRDAVQVTGYGETRPAFDNATREGRVQNRRVEITTDVRERAR